MRYPFHLIAHLLHAVDKFFPCAALCHGLVNGIHQLEFIAAAPYRRPVLTCTHWLLLWLLVGRQDFQPMSNTDFIRQGTKLLQILFVKLQFQPCDSVEQLYRTAVLVSIVTNGTPNPFLEKTIQEEAIITSNVYDC